MGETAMTDRLEQQDPRRQYPDPAFLTAAREMPGRVSNVASFPDHGVEGSDGRRGEASFRQGGEGQRR
ncbi:MAG: hypothetical protein DI595_04105 [Agrobacterium fabrum]|uniref:Uncharacterized protein n=1 Tax=Agrobacterium fabrum TaxID=1176649 RepID=A0A2W5FEB1_9HYPH|nr:MAG: hypothetical protein DI595_04105 [Agrobacterium fabrum]